MDMNAGRYINQWFKNSRIFWPPRVQVKELPGKGDGFRPQRRTCPTWRWTLKATVCPPILSSVFFFQVRFELPASKCTNIPLISCQNVIPPAPSNPTPSNRVKLLLCLEGFCTLLHPSHACNKGLFF